MLRSLDQVDRDAGGRSRAGQCSDRRSGRQLVTSRRWNDDLVDNAENLANVGVGALSIALRVLVGEGGVRIVSSGGSLTGITTNHGCEAK